MLDAGNSISGLHGCTASVLAPELSLQPLTCGLKAKLGPIEMAQQVKTLAPKSDSLTQYRSSDPYGRGKEQTHRHTLN